MQHSVAPNNSRVLACLPPQTFYADDLEHQRVSAEREYFIPYSFRRVRPADPRTLAPDCRVLGVSQLRECVEPSRVLLLHLEDLAGKVDDATLTSLGRLMEPFVALQTLVVRKCGVGSVRGRNGWGARVQLCFVVSLAASRLSALPPPPQ